jgi:DNA-binding transcriptional regulator LsrR (DeoR family)
VLRCYIDLLFVQHEQDITSKTIAALLTLTSEVVKVQKEVKVTTSCGIIKVRTSKAVEDSQQILQL